MIRILVAEDHKAWRQRIRSLLEARPELRVICEVPDGLEAVQKAEELQPSLILLDIGLPKISGIEAAKRIRKVCEQSKILFLSQESSSEILQEALNSGALGYVYKPRAAVDLLSAIDAVLNGKTFLGIVPKQGTDSVNGTARPRFRHEALFYSDDVVLVERFADAISEALKAGRAAIAIVTELHRLALLQRLRTEAVDVDVAIQQGTCILVDAEDTLSSIMAEGLPDPQRALHGFSHLIDLASQATKAREIRITVCGERVGLLWARGQTDAAIRLEQLCNEVGKRHEIDMLCGYPIRELEGQNNERAFGHICREHSAVSSR